jgi:hypothetical protein
LQARRTRGSSNGSYFTLNTIYRIALKPDRFLGNSLDEPEWPRAHGITPELLAGTADRHRAGNRGEAAAQDFGEYAIFALQVKHNRQVIGAFYIIEVQDAFSARGRVGRIECALEMRANRRE